MGDCVMLPSFPPNIANSMIKTNFVCPSTLKFPPPSTGTSSKLSAKGRGQKSCAKGAVLGSGQSNEFIGKLVEDQGGTIEGLHWDTHSKSTNYLLEGNQQKGAQ
jgi:hypothetical protein